MLTLLTAQPRWGAASAGGEAYARLREWIITLELAPASLLDERDLMRRLKLGRTPVREALQRLAHEDLVIILPRRGTLVADINPADLQKIFEVRLELEPFAAGLAARRARPDDVTALRGIMRAIDKAARARGPRFQRELIRLDQASHARIATATGNPFLSDALDRLYGHVARLWYLSLERVTRLAEAVEEHRTVTEAIAAGDARTAARAMRAHVAGFQEQMRFVE
jgi:DNA-binding GntR family transcriptional regulator